MRQDIVDACKILEIDDISKLNKEKLRKYRKRVLKKYHPDAVGRDTDRSRDISIAYTKLLEYISFIELNLKSVDSGKKKILLRMSTLMSLCKGGSIDAGDGYGNIKYTDLRQYITMIKIEYTVWINGDKRDCVCIKNFDMRDMYEVVEYLEYNANDIIEIELYGNKVKFVGNGTHDVITVTSGEKGDVRYPKVRFVFIKDNDSD